MMMMTTHWYDSIDDGSLLYGDAQGLHVEVEERVEDGHWGRLEQEDKLDPHLVMMMLMLITVRMMIIMIIIIIRLWWWCHWGRLEQEDKLDPDLMQIMLIILRMAMNNFRIMILERMMKGWWWCYTGLLKKKLLICVGYRVPVGHCTGVWLWSWCWWWRWQYCNGDTVMIMMVNARMMIVRMTMEMIMVMVMTVRLCLGWLEEKHQTSNFKNCPAIWIVVSGYQDLGIFGCLDIWVFANMALPSVSFWSLPRSRIGKRQDPRSIQALCCFPGNTANDVDYDDDDNCDDDDWTIVLKM